MESSMACFLAAVEMLKDLPYKRDTLVSLLTDIGVRGIPGDGTACVLAEYLTAVVWPDDEVTVQMMSGALHVGFDDIEMIYNLPDHLQDFTTAFDAGEYPALCR